MSVKNIIVYPRIPENLHKLIHLGFNLWSIWDREAIRLFSQIDPALFISSNKNPIRFLHNLPATKLNELSKNKLFLQELDKVWNKFQSYLSFKTPIGERLEGKNIAYFSMEYGLHHSIPIYAGGLGILSGDHLKGASDLNIPVTGVGLFYRYGYFIQNINIYGIQEEKYSEIKYHYIPIKELKDKNKKPIYFNIRISDQDIKVKIWCVNIGINRILLLDTKLDENPEEFRDITDFLYVADRDKRIQQEIILGFGGIIALELAGVKPDIYHINEGHSAFLIVERLRKLIKEQGMSFDEAYTLIKNTTIFTTHTPVEAGNENFSVEQIKKYLQKTIEEIGINFDDFIKFGRRSDEKTFWLPAFAIHFSRYINGVSRLHSEVSRNMWNIIYPRMNPREVPIEHITNGVHYSWLSNELQELFKRYIGENFIYSDGEADKWKGINNIPDEEIWDAHIKRKRSMIVFLRKILEQQYTKRGHSITKINRIKETLNPDFLTIGFARRFAEYKRPTLILKNRERLKKILLNRDRPVQIIFAGKAHPADIAGKNMIKEVIDYAREEELEDRLIFVENYSMEIARYLVQGVDLWLNTPIKPMEASGTSGMKAGINGVLNLSVLDGWWPEGYNGRNGWAITAGELYSDPGIKSTAEADQIYELLEEEILPLYYERDELNIPRGWVKMMKESILTIYSRFNINMTLYNYSTKFYLPAISNREKLLENNYRYLKEIVESIKILEEKWDGINFKDIFSDIDSKEIFYVNDTIKFECYLALNDVSPELLAVEIVCQGEKDDSLEVYKLNFKEKYEDGTAKYSGTVSISTSGQLGFQIRLVPSNDDIRATRPDLIKWAD